MTRKKMTLLIKAIPSKKGGYYLKAENGELPEEGYCHRTRAEAYKVASKLWPSNSSWHGKKVSGGYRIKI